MKKVLSILLAVLLVFGMLPASALTVFAADSYEKATSIAVGDTVVLVYETGKMELSSISTTNTKYGIGVAYSSAPTGAMPLAVVEGSTSGTYAFQTEDGKYLYWTSGNSLNVDSTLSDKTSWTVTFDDSGNAVIANANTSGRTIRWNISSPRFACYTSGQTAVQLYKLNTSACDHINKVSNNDAVAPSCTEAGQTDSYYCPDCTETIDAEPVDALGHSYVDGICSVCGEEEPEGYVLTDIANIKAGDVVIITMAKGSDVYAMSNSNGTSSAPKASKVTVANDTITEATDDLLWNVGGSADAYIFYPNGTTASWLYCTSTNNGVRVGTNTANTFKIDATSGYLVHNDTGRYIGVYNSADWRCYTSVNNNIKEQTLAFYVKSADSSGCEECVPGTPVKENEVAATCTKEGSYESVTYCTECGNVITRETVTVSMIDHVYENGACTSCGKVDPSVETKAELMATLPGNGDKIIIYNPSSKTAMGIGDADSDSKLDSVSTEPVGTLLPYNTAVAVLTVEIDGDYFAFKLDDGTYLATDSDGGQLTFEATASDLTLWSIASVDGLWTITSKTATNSYGEQAIEYYLGEYTTYAGSGDAFNMALYLVEKGENACTHENTTEQSDGYAATCTEPGKTNSWTCDACGVTVTAQQEIPTQGHSYEDGACTVCGAEEPQRYYIAAYRNSESTYYYMTGDLGSASTKRYQATGAGNLLPPSIAPDQADSAYTFILTENDDGSYYIQAENVTGDNYLGWSSGNSGILVAKDDETARKLTIDPSTNVNGAFNIHFTGDEERYLSLNSAANSNYFAWYKGTQAQDLILIPVKETTDTTVKLYGDAKDVTYDGDLYLDVNGFAATNVTATKIYAYDSSASAAAAGTGSITTSSEVVMDNTVSNIRYIALAEGEEETKTYTFHVLEMKLSAVTLRANEECGIYYKATYACDDTLKNAIDSYGVVFSLQDMPGADFKTEENGRNLYTVYNKDSFVSGAEVTSGSIFGIMKDTEDRAALAAEQGKTLAQLNAEYGKMDIHANAYIVINGETLVGTGASYSLFTVMKAMNDNWAKYETAGKTDAIKAFYEMWKDEGMSEWASELPNIAG